MTTTRHAGGRCSGVEISRERISEKEAERDKYILEKRSDATAPAAPKITLGMYQPRCKASRAGIHDPNGIRDQNTRSPRRRSEAELTSQSPRIGDIGQSVRSRQRPSRERVVRLSEGETRRSRGGPASRCLRDSMNTADTHGALISLRGYGSDNDTHRPHVRIYK